MRFMTFMLGVTLTVSAWAEVGVDVSSGKDSVMKIVYTGGSPTDSQAVLTVSGKKIGTRSVANYASGASGILGIVAGSAAPTNSYPVGVSGSGVYGVYGTGNVGLWGEGATGMVAIGSGSGAEIYARGQYGTSGVVVDSRAGYYVWGINAYADSGGSQTIGVSGVAGVGDPSIGVYGHSDYEGGYAGWFDGDIYVAGDINPSDEMFKKDIQPLTASLDKVMALRPKRYLMKTDEFRDRINLPKGEQFGLLAQEVQSVLPQLVREATAPVRLTAVERNAKVRKQALKFKSVNYNALIPVLLGAIQEQQAQIEAMKTRIQQLENGR